MRVRVFDKDTGKYFKSEVYAIINKGWFSRYLLLLPKNDKYFFKLYDCMDRTQKYPPFQVYINIITPEIPCDWIQKEGVSLLKDTTLLEMQNSTDAFDFFRGYPWLLRDDTLMCALLQDEAVESTGERIDSRLKDWNYVETFEDIQKLYYDVDRFHDSVLKSMDYVSGSRIEDGGMKVTDDVRQVRMVFDTGRSLSLEMMFEGVLALNLRPAQDNITSEIYSGSVILQNETVFFCDLDWDDEQDSCPGTWIRAFSLRWRLK